MLPALGTLATQQAMPTKNTMKQIKQFLKNASTNPDAVITYHASNMILAGHNDALYLSISNAQSRARGHFFVSSNVELPPNNGTVSTVLQIIKAVISLAAEAKVGALSSIAMKQCQQSMSLNSWDTHNRPHQCRRTTRQPRSRVAEWLGGAESSKRSRVRTLRKRWS